jgi:hypothetical protein
MDYLSLTVILLISAFHVARITWTTSVWLPCLLFAGGGGRMGLRRQKRIIVQGKSWSLQQELHQLRRKTSLPNPQTDSFPALTNIQLHCLGSAGHQDLDVKLKCSGTYIWTSSFGKSQAAAQTILGKTLCKVVTPSGWSSRASLLGKFLKGVKGWCCFSFRPYQMPLDLSKIS